MEKRSCRKLVVCKAGAVTNAKSRLSTELGHIIGAAYDWKMKTIKHIIYDITKYNKEVVAKVNTNASGPVGNRIQNDFSTNNISKSREKVNTDTDNFTKDDT